MKVHGNMDFLMNTLKNTTFHQYDTYPANPKVGTLALILKRLMLCVEFMDAPIWLPLTQELNTYVHTQSVESDTWTVPHNLGSSTVLVQVFDENNLVILPDEIDTSLKDTTTVTFVLPVKGRVICILGDFIGLPKADVRYTEEFTLNATWTVNHGLGYEPVIRCISNGLEIQPDAIVHNSTTKATVTFSNPRSGKVVAI